jgi:hypothetical protein
MRQDFAVIPSEARNLLFVGATTTLARPGDREGHGFSRLP